MKVTDKIETDTRYYWKRSDGWKWFDGQERWWEYFVIIDGFNGGGGLWIRIISRWNSGSQDMFTQPETLSYEKSQDLIRDIESNLAA